MKTYVIGCTRPFSWSCVQWCYWQSVQPRLTSPLPGARGVDLKSPARHPWTPSCTFTSWFRYSQNTNTSQAIECKFPKHDLIHINKEVNFDINLKVVNFVMPHLKRGGHRNLFKRSKFYDTIVGTFHKYATR